MKNVDWKAVAIGAVVTIAVGIAASVIANLIGLGDDSSGWILFFWIDVIGAGVGGYLAGKRRLDTPLLHGALAGLFGYIVVALVGTAINVAGGHGAPSPIQAVFAAMWLAVGGTLGGYVASWRAQKLAPPAPPMQAAPPTPPTPTPSAQIPPPQPTPPPAAPSE
jgi:putative membrane protein (TIGR04086 family)